jgi:hypothetical protein
MLLWGNVAESLVTSFLPYTTAVVKFAEEQAMGDRKRLICGKMVVKESNSLGSAIFFSNVFRLQCMDILASMLNSVELASCRSAK